MKIRKNVVAWMGIILCVLIAGVILATPANDLYALLPAALFIPFVITLRKNDSNEEEDEEMTYKKRVNWLRGIAWTLVVLAAVCAIIVAIFFGWWFLLPLAIMFGLLTWVAYLLEWHTAWTCLFIALIVIAIVLLGVYGIVDSTGGVGNNDRIDNLYVGNLYVENETATNQTVTNQDVEDQTVTNQVVENQTANNQVVEDQTVNNQVVENQTVNKTEPPATEPPATEPPATEPPATEPPATEPPATEPVHTHSYTSVVTQPTCMELGYTTHTCECGDSYKDSYKGALGHSYKSEVIEPTTSACGYTKHTCERCGHSYKDAFTDKLPEVVPAIKCANTIRYGETVYVNLEGIEASNLLVSNKLFVDVEVISANRVAITLNEDVTGYITITDSVSRVNVIIDIVEA